MISVKDLLKRFTPEDLNRKAEEYFAKIDDRTYLLSKPFAAADEAAKLLFQVGALLQGLHLHRYMDVLDFGAGSCWSSHMLSQLGCKVYAVDVAPTALDIGRERYRRHPPFGEQPEPEFLVYDGHRLPLPDESIDRILCCDAFHHVPNPEGLIREMSRVLRKDGLAGFAEPGPDHSSCPESQHEMEAYGVLENDVVIEDVWRWARDAGFGRIELSTFSMEPVRFELADYERFIAGASSADAAVLDTVRYYARATRTFFLGKEAKRVLDSRSKKDLRAELEVVLRGGPVFAPGIPLPLSVRVKNTSPARWLPISAKLGGVDLGVHLLDLGSGRFDNDYARILLTPGEGRPIHPGEELAFDAAVPCPPPGAYEIELDLVSEGVVWFKFNQSPTCRLRIEVRPS
jgi:SAM-dependent methyltransferase